MQLSVKNVEGNIFKEFKAEAVREGLPVGKSLTLAMKFWLEKKERKNKMSILDIKTKNWTKGSEKTSEDIDKILYENGNSH